MSDRIPNAPFREAFLATGLSASVVCFRLGWLDRSGADTSRLKRLLGINETISNSSRGRYSTRSRVMAVSTAKAICAAACLDFDAVLDEGAGVEQIAREWLCAPYGTPKADQAMSRLLNSVGRYVDLMDPPARAHCWSCDEGMLAESLDGLCGFCREESGLLVAA